MEQISPVRAEQLLFIMSFVRLSSICAAPLGLGGFFDFVPGALPQADVVVAPFGAESQASFVEVVAGFARDSAQPT